MPDKDFLERLEKQMEQEQKQKKISHSHNIYFRICAAAAAVCLIIGGAFFIKNSTGNNAVQKDLSADESEADIKIGTGSDDNSENKISFQKGIFRQKDILKNESSKTAKLSEIINENETKVYKSNNEKFSFDSELSDEEKKSLAESIDEFTEKTDEKQSEDAVYYMAVSQSGDVVKFEIFEGKYLKINGYDEIYKK